MKICIVCKNKNIKLFLTIKDLIYWKCFNCDAVLLDTKNYIDLKSEKKHYLKHKNSIDDNKHQKFLLRLLNPLKTKITIDEIGLDYGCGYSPVLAHMLKKDGYKIEIYDPFFFPNETIFLRKFKYITCSEVVEHFYSPFEEFNRLNNLLDDNSWLVIMTSILKEENMFRDWHYRRDPTHVVFYKKKTFSFIANYRNWDLFFPSEDIVLLKKN